MVALVWCYWGAKYWIIMFYDRTLLIKLEADMIHDYCCSPEEAGRYLETYKVYENKPPDALLGQSEGDYLSKVTLRHVLLCDSVPV